MNEAELNGDLNKNEAQKKDIMKNIYEPSHSWTSTL
jgi:hypothetical protein